MMLDYGAVMAATEDLGCNDVYEYFEKKAERLGRIYRIHLQDQRERTQQEAGGKLITWLTVRP
jgi:hypothetical protein